MGIKMEIGGYFGFEKYNGSLYHENAMQFNSARNCLRFLIREKKIKKIFLPYFLCSAIKEVCIEEKCSISFYHINENFLIEEPVNNFIQGTDYLYLVNYAGILTKSYIWEQKQKYENIILDNVQSYFERPLKGIDTLYSCRKYFGVTDGGFLYTKLEMKYPYERDHSFDRLEFLAGRYEYSAEEFYHLFQSNENMIENQPIMKMSALTENILRSLDYLWIIETRNKNYNFLHSHLNVQNKLILKTYTKGPLAYPFWISGGREIREKLIKRKIFIPQYWPELSELSQQGKREWEFANDILWIPCDHRYTIEDMKYLLYTLKNCVNS